MDVVPRVPQDKATGVGLGKGDSISGSRSMHHSCVGCVEPVPDGWEVGRDHPLG